MERVPFHHNAKKHSGNTVQARRIATRGAKYHPLRRKGQPILNRSRRVRGRFEAAEPDRPQFRTQACPPAPPGCPRRATTSRDLLLQSDTNTVRIGTIDPVRIEILNRHDALEDAARSRLRDSDHTEPRRASHRGMRVAAERVRTAEGDKHMIPGRGHIRKVWS